MLTENTIQNEKVESSAPYYHLQVRDKTQILKDGSEVANQYHRTSIECGDWSSAEERGLLLTAQNAWTDEVINAFNAKMSEDNPEWVNRLTYNEYKAQ